jgi:hypothetical protein
MQSLIPKWAKKVIEARTKEKESEERKIHSVLRNHGTKKQTLTLA